MKAGQNHHASRTGLKHGSLGPSFGIWVLGWGGGVSWNQYLSMHPKWFWCKGPQTPPSATLDGEKGPLWRENASQRINISQQSKELSVPNNLLWNTSRNTRTGTYSIEKLEEDRNSGDSSGVREGSPRCALLCAVWPVLSASSAHWTGMGPFYDHCLSDPEHGLHFFLVCLPGTPPALLFLTSPVGTVLHELFHMFPPYPHAMLPAGFSKSHLDDREDRNILLVPLDSCPCSGQLLGCLVLFLLWIWESTPLGQGWADEHSGSINPTGPENHPSLLSTSSWCY